MGVGCHRKRGRANSHSRGPLCNGGGKDTEGGGNTCGHGSMQLLQCAQSTRYVSVQGLVLIFCWGIKFLFVVISGRSFIRSCKNA